MIFFTLHNFHNISLCSRFLNNVVYTKLFLRFILSFTHSRFENHRTRMRMPLLLRLGHEKNTKRNIHTFIIALLCDCWWFLLIHNACWASRFGSFKFSHTFTKYYLRLEVPSETRELSCSQGDLNFFDSTRQGVPVEMRWKGFPSSFVDIVSFQSWKLSTMCSEEQRALELENSENEIPARCWEREYGSCVRSSILNIDAIRTSMTNLSPNPFVNIIQISSNLCSCFIAFT